MSVSVDKHWHETEYRLDLGRMVGKIGSLTYLIDEEYRAISKGYHTIRLGVFSLVGELGRCEEKVCIIPWEESSRVIHPVDEVITLLDELRLKVERMR